MKTIEELFKEISACEEKKTALAKAIKNGTITDFLKKNGCDASLKDVQEFFKSKKTLSEEELTKVAGGGCSTDVFGWMTYGALSVLTVGTMCAVTTVCSAAVAGGDAIIGDGDEAAEDMEECSKGLITNG